MLNTEPQEEQVDSDIRGSMTAPAKALFQRDKNNDAKLEDF